MTANAGNDLDDAAWKAVVDFDTIDEYRNLYLDKEFKKHRFAASTRIEELAAGVFAKDLENPKFKYESEWLQALASDSIPQYIRYVKSFGSPDCAEPGTAPKTDEQLAICAEQKRRVEDARNQIAHLLSLVPKQTNAKKTDDSGQAQPVTSVHTTAGDMTVVAMDAMFLKEPSCIICSEKTNVLNVAAQRPIPAKNFCRNALGKTDLYINPRLETGWLIYVDGAGNAYKNIQSHGVEERLQLPNSPTLDQYIGHSGNYTLYAENKKKYYDFVLFILEATAQSSSAGQSGKSGASNKPTQGPGVAAPSFVIPE